METHRRGKKLTTARLTAVVACASAVLAVMAPTASARHHNPRPQLSWTIAHSASEGQSIPFSWSGRRLGRNHRLVVQRPVGTAHVWKTILRLPSNSGSGELPGMALGRYRLRLADFALVRSYYRGGRRHRRRAFRWRLVAKRVVGIGVFGQVPFTTLFNQSHVGALATPTASFSYVQSWPVYDSRNLFGVTHNNCVSVHIAFVPHFRDDEGDGTVTVVQESRDPVSATVPFETAGSVDVGLTPGQTWGVNATNSPNLSIGLAEPEYYINGYAVCDSTESLFSR